MPASYPGSVKSFTSKVDGAGNKIFAAHINDLQDEVTAIEGGILNGTAPVNSSNSTLANLSVTGKSTLAGNVQMGGNCTIAGSLTVGGAITLSGVQTVDVQPRIRIFNSTTQAIAQNTETALTFDSEDFDPQGLHSTGTNPTRINITSTGVWLLGATVTHNTAYANSLRLRFMKNSTTTIDTWTNFTGDGSNGVIRYLHKTCIEVFADTTDYVEAIALTNQGGGVTTGAVGSSRKEQNEFWAVKLW